MDRILPHVNIYGTADISNASTIDEALQYAGLDWEVKQFPIFDETGAEYQKYRMNKRLDTGEALGIVTQSYIPVQNNDAFRFVDSLSESGDFKFDKAGSFKNGKSIWVMGHLPEVDILGDTVDNNLVFINSHDGTSGVKVMMTPVRVICQNMLNIATKEARRSWSTRHTVRIGDRLEEAKFTLNLANNYIDSLSTTAEKLADKRITDVQLEAIFDSLFPVDRLNDTERKITNITVMKNELFECYNADDIKKFYGTAWGVINAVSDFVGHRTPSRVTKDYNENAWNRLINGHAVLDSFVRVIG